eukprot:snap_masked-scaffold_60-processed-gene-0.35-mRNA-1 protein AED:1.00 eAED:1.00 QI:0/-1/0/0/-1/1/1/0/239
MLRSNGDTNFEDLLFETLWDIIAHDIDQDLDADHEYSPRVFKSHETYENISEGAKYIFVLRDPYDMFVSTYHFFLHSPKVNPYTCSMTAFSKLCFERKGRFSRCGEYIVSYVNAMKNNPRNMLLLFYEDMKEKLRENIEKIAKFMGLSKLSEEEFKARCDTAEMYSSLKYMKENKDKFGVVGVLKRGFKKMPEMRAVMGGDDELTLVKSGKTAGGKTIPEEVKKLIEKSWKDIVQNELG